MIRLAEPTDLPGIVALLADANLCHDDLTSDHMADCITVYDDAQLIGAVGLEVFGQDALLRSLIVAPNLRGKSVGGQLVDAIETHARLKNVSTLFLLTTTADLFFEHRGYKRIDRDSVADDIGKTTEFASFCPDSAVCMRKRLD